MDDDTQVPLDNGTGPPKTSDELENTGTNTDRGKETPRHTYLTRDQRLQAATLYRHGGLSLRETAQRLGFSIQQVRTAVSSPPTPRKRKGRPSKLSDDQVAQLVEFVRASPANRELSYKQLAERLPFNCSEWSIRTALRKKGLARRSTTGTRARCVTDAEQRQAEHNKSGKDQTSSGASNN